MSERTILQFDCCGHSPTWPEIPKVMRELENEGFGFHPARPPEWNDPCLVCFSGGDVRGFLVYRHEEASSSWFILLAHVAPVFRRRGIHTSLFNALVERAELRGDILSINSGTHVDNIAAQAAFAAQGRSKSAIFYRYVVREWLDGKPYRDVPEAEQ